MKFEIGDSVVVKRTREKGRVIEMLGDDMIMLENDKGVRFPVFEEDIEYPYFEMFSEKKIKPPKSNVIYADQLKTEKKNPEKFEREGVLMNVLPVLDKDIFDDDVVEQLRIYLVNRNQESYFFEYKYLNKNGLVFELKSTVEAGKQFYLHAIPFEDLNDKPQFSFLFYPDKKNKHQAPYHECFVNPSGKKLFMRIQDMLGKQEATFAFPLFDKYPESNDKVQKEKPINLSVLKKSGFKVYDVKDGKKHLPNPRSIVDLHAEALGIDTFEMDAAQILQAQIQAFETWLDIAIGHEQKDITFIHGIGNGILKDKLHGLLDKRREVKKFIQDQHPQFGNGATIVYLR